MMYIDQGAPLCPRTSVLDSTAQLQVWEQFVENQQHGAITKSLPTTCVKAVSFGFTKDIQYDTNVWVRKNVTEGDQFDFHYEPTKNYWRHRTDLLEFGRCARKKPNATTAPTYNVFTNIIRCDYMAGLLDPPSHGLGKDGQNWQTPLCVINKNPTTACLKQLLSKDHGKYGKAGNVQSYASAALINASWGTFSEIFDGLRPVPVYDSHPMKPILFAFSRFMKGDSVQPYRVYGEFQITHEIEVLKNHMFHSNHSDNWWPNEVSGTNETPPIMFGEVPIYYSSGDVNVVTQAGTDRRQNVQFRPFPVYNPYVYSTTNTVVGEVEQGLTEDD